MSAAEFLNATTWEWLNSNLGSGFLFFVLDVVIVVTALPAALAFRSARAARSNWRRAVQNISYSLLAIADDATAESRDRPIGPGTAERIIGYAEEIESVALLMGRDAQAFRKFAQALFELLPLVVRLRRRLGFLLSDNRHRSALPSILDRDLNEYADVVTRHAATLRKFAKLSGRPSLYRPTIAS